MNQKSELGSLGVNKLVSLGKKSILEDQTDIRKVSEPEVTGGYRDRSTF